jgi:hypothetical protein
MFKTLNVNGKVELMSKNNEAMYNVFKIDKIRLLEMILHIIVSDDLSHIRNVQTSWFHITCELFWNNSVKVQTNILQKTPYQIEFILRCLLLLILRNFDIA